MRRQVLGLQVVLQASLALWLQASLALWLQAEIQFLWLIWRVWLQFQWLIWRHAFLVLDLALRVVDHALQIWRNAFRRNAFLVIDLDQRERSFAGELSALELSELCELSELHEC